MSLSPIIWINHWGVDRPDRAIWKLSVHALNCSLTHRRQDAASPFDVILHVWRGWDPQVDFVVGFDWRFGCTDVPPEKHNKEDTP